MTTSTTPALYTSTSPTTGEVQLRLDPDQFARKLAPSPDVLRLVRVATLAGLGEWGDPQNPAPNGWVDTTTPGTFIQRGDRFELTRRRRIFVDEFSIPPIVYSEQWRARVGGQVWASNGTEAAVTNTTAESFLWAASQFVFPPDTLSPSDEFIFEAAGRVSNSTGAAATVTIFPHFGARSVCGGIVLPVAAGLSGFWSARALVSIRTVGAAGEMRGSGEGQAGSGRAPATLALAQTLDTTAEVYAAFTAQWSVANVGLAIRSDMWSLRITN